MELHSSEDEFVRETGNGYVASAFSRSIQVRRFSHPLTISRSKLTFAKGNSRSFPFQYFQSCKRSSSSVNRSFTSHNLLPVNHRLQFVLDWNSNLRPYVYRSKVTRTISSIQILRTVHRNELPFFCNYYWRELRTTVTEAAQWFLFNETSVYL